MYLEGKKVKKVEGIEWRPEQVRMVQDEEAAREANGDEKKKEDDVEDNKNMNGIVATTSTMRT
jgi:hypothetical protein